MRITDIRVAAVPISSPISNAYIDFSKMDAAVVAIVTDAVRDGERLSATVSIRMAAMRRSGC